MAIDIKAKLSNLDTSAQKARLVIDLVRGKPALEALDILKFTPNKSAEPVRKLVQSAIANGEENYGVAREDMYIHKIFADEAPTRKWRRFGARGRFKPILRRRSHITVILREAE